MLLAAAACLGGDGPTQVLTVGRAAGGRFTGLPERQKAEGLIDGKQGKGVYVRDSLAR
ncbi:hypothetical protein [Micromonospora inositola]|uniref:Uncharacterized protein n=1 Tax=Micromonospora inositola TaxID=47865 RepID=A0A1C5H5H1_9ACTN|nr:hypothetical protein [Micromonospora inositola]SCG41137.1 hypothetical protein GA0070613_0845 [Micromonospora inositola]